MLTERETYAWTWLALLRACVGILMLWLVVEAIAPGRLGFAQAAFAYAIAQVVSAISLSPGGLGALEAGTAGLLVAVGLPVHVATAAALLQRLTDKGFATVIGMLLFAWARKRYHFEGAALFHVRQAEVPAG